MKRPMLHIAISFGTGILIAWFVKQAVFIFVVTLCMVLLYIHGNRKRILFHRGLLLWGLFFLLGYLNYSCQFTWLQYPLQPFYDNSVLLKGYVVNAPVTESNRTTFNFQVETIGIKDSEFSVRRVILVNVYNAYINQDFSAGRYLSIGGALKKPEGQRNPGGFNYSAYLYSRKTFAVLSVNAKDVTQFDRLKNLPLQEFGFKARNHILSTLDIILSGEKAALMAAMLTGYRENLTVPMEDAFRASGLMHIMAISGAHIAFLIFPVLWIFQKISLNRKAGAGITVLLLFFYVLITGMGSSVLRAALMALIILTGKILDRKAEVINSLGVAAFILLLINPFMLFDVGFQLSVSATAGIGVLYKKAHGIMPEKIPGIIRGTLAATISAQAGVLPILIRSFSKVSLISLLSNLMVVPLTGASTVLGAVAVILGSICPVSGIWCGFMLEGLLHGILVITDVMSSISWAEVNAHHWDFWRIGLYYAVLILIGCFGTIIFTQHKKKLAVGVLILGIVLFVQGVQPGRLKLVFTDVGQGDSILIQTPKGYNLLIDGGGSYNETETKYIGHQVLLPLMMHEGISKIDLALVSHAHTDHLSGVMTLMEVFPIRAVGLPQYSGTENDFCELLQICSEKGTEVEFYSRGDDICLDNETTFHILYPDEETDFGQSNLNNTSLSGMLRFGEFQVLFTGDMERQAEKVFIESNKTVDCDILKVAHHGGENSTLEQFLVHVSPEVAVISVGKNNFGHPSEDTLNRLSLFGSKVYTTIHCGAVIIDSDGIQYRIKPWRRNEKFTLFPEKD